MVLQWSNSFRVSSGAQPLELDQYEVVEETVLGWNLGIVFRRRAEVGFVFFLWGGVLRRSEMD